MKHQGADSQKIIENNFDYSIMGSQIFKDSARNAGNDILLAWPILVDLNFEL